MKKYRIAALLITVMILVVGTTQTVLANYDDYIPERGETLYVIAEEFITLREYPSTDAPELDHIPTCASVTFLDIADDDFYRVRYDGQVGYVLDSYLDYMEPQIAIQRWMTVVNCEESITLRDIPSTDGDEICQIPKGESVYVRAQPNSEFYKVEYDGCLGYAMKAYIK